MPAPPNPYFIYIELFWPDGHAANQNEIARVIAYDVNTSVTPNVVTNEGQSGFNPSTGGWQPIFMQNFAAFYPPREKPNLKFEVVSTQEVSLYTTVVFNAIPSGSTVHIIIGQSAVIVGGGTTTFTVTGHARKKSNSAAFFPGNVQVFDVTHGSEVLLGTTALASDGGYSVSFTSDQFTNNGGGSHVQPNLQVRLFDPTTALLLDQSEVKMGWVQGQLIDLEVDDSVPNPQEHRVFGTVRNNLGLPVAGVTVQAFDVIWNTTGLQEIFLGTAVSGAGGAYSIVYQPPNPAGAPAACAPAPDQINILVKAVAPATATSPPTSPPGTTILATAGVFFNAAQEQQADLVVNKTAVSTDSEYTRLNNAIAGCFGTQESERWNTLKLLNTRPDLLTFVAQSSGQPEAQVRAYVQAWLIAAEIKDKVFNPPPPTSPPTSPPPVPLLFHLVLPLSAEVMYGLVRDGLGVNLTDLLDVEPDSFFDAVIETIHQGIISASIEVKLRPSSPTAKDSLVDDWRTVLAKMMTRAPGSGEKPQWQTQLLQLAFPDTPTSPTATGAATPFQFPLETAAAHNVVLPNPVTPGELLIVLLTVHTNSVVAAPSGWTRLGTTAVNGANPLGLTAFYKVAVAGDNGATVNFTGVAANGAAQLLRVAAGTWAPTSTGGVDISFGTPGSGSSTTLDPPPAAATQAPSVAPGSLFLAIGAFIGNGSVTGQPGGYTTPVKTNSTHATLSVSVVSSQRVAVSANENPSPFTITSAVWVSATIAITATTISQVAKRDAVVRAHFDTQGSFDDVLKVLQQSTNPSFTSLELENLRFVFEMYDQVADYYPIVAAVYPSKATRGWKTIENLSTVTLSEWISFALAQQSFSFGQFGPPNGFPGDIPGTTASELAAVYGQRLFDLFGGVNPQNRFMAAAVQSPPNAGIAQINSFLVANPSFSLESSNIDVFNAAALQSPPTSPITAPLPAALVPQMKQLQRVYRLTNDAVAAQALIANGYDSAVKISQVEEGAFIASQERFVGGLTAARNIHRTASYYTSEVVNNVVRFHQNLTDVGGMTAITGAPNFTLAGSLVSIDPTEGFIPNLGGIDNAFSPDPRKLPNWTTLFGNLNACACKCCQTALSPGAYLVDILEFVNAGPRKALLERRPDLQDLEITCTNTFTVLPYIDLVNETLENAVVSRAFPLTTLTSPIGPISAATMDSAVAGTSPTSDALVRQAFRDHGYVLGEKAIIRRSAEDKNVASPPVNPPTQRVWIVDDDSWQFTVRGFTPPFSVNPVPQTGKLNDSLEVFPEHVNTPAYDILATTVFPFNLPLSLGKEEANIFLQAKEVRQHEVLEAFTIDDRDTVLAKGTGALAFLNLSNAEAQAIIASSFGPTYWGFNTESPVSIPNPSQPTQTLTGPWMDLLTLVPVFLHRSGLTYQELLDLLDTAFVQIDAGLAGKVLHISATGDELAECDFNKFQIAHLNDTTAGRPSLRRISFFIRLWRRLGWTMRELDTYLMSLETGVIPANLVQVSEVKRLIDQLELEPRQVFSFWSNLDTRRTARNPKSLFDETFLVGSADQPELVDLETVARGGSVPLAGTAPPTASEDLKNHVRGVLRLKAADIDLLWPTSGLLTVAALSQIYRVAAFTRALEISVVDFFDLVALTGTNPFPATPASPLASLLSRIIKVFDTVVDIRRAQSTEMSPGETQYYLTDFSDAGDKFVAKREDLNAAAQRLSLSVGEIAASLPFLPHPDATALSTLLAKVVPADKVVRSVTIITPVFPEQNPLASPPPPPPPPNPPTVDDIAFLKRYFAPFISAPPGPDVFLTNLFAESDGPTRYKTVFDQANAYLVDQAKTTAVVNITSELFATDRDTVDLLLTESLSSTHGRPTAMDDWKAILSGGWDTGDLTIENQGPKTWNGVIVTPRGGDFRFVVSIDTNNAPAAFTLAIDDGTPATAGLPKNPAAAPPKSPPASPPTPLTQFVYDPVSLKGGAVLNVKFTYTGAFHASLLWRIDNGDPVVVPATVTLPMTIVAPLKAAPPNASPPAQVPPVQPSEYLKLFKATRMATGLALTRAELRYLVQVQPPLPASPPNPQALSFSFDKLPVLAADPDVTWATFAVVIDLLGLNRSITFKAKTLFEFWNDVANPTIDDVFNQTDWKVEDIAAVQTLWGLHSPPVGLPSFRDPAIWYVLRQTMDIVNRLDLRARRILDLLVLIEPTAGSVAALRNAFRSQFSKQEWKDVFKPLRDPLRQQQRDALVGYLTTRPITIGSKVINFIDANDLYAYFLIDVEMQADTLISRMVLAHLVVQLFVDRVFLGLEDPANFSNLDDAKDVWTWMQRFRVWEANRKVFLWPENYIEPELRDDKTPFFKELEDELLQGNVTDDIGVTALTNYLDKLNEASNLEIMGSYTQGNSQSVNYVLHVVGRTRTEPRTFYYRSFIGKQAAEGTWTPWINIPIEIKADVVAPVIFNGRLHLYWPQIKLKQRADPPKDDKGNPAVSNESNVADEHHTTYAAEIKLMFTEYVVAQNKWLKPKISRGFAVDADAPTPFTNEVGEALPPTDNYHLRVDSAGKDFLKINLIKTHTPEPPLVVTTPDTVIPGSPFPFWFGRGPQRIPGKTTFYPQDQVTPALLGSFQFWYTGDDTFEPPANVDSVLLSLGKNWPVNTALKHNGAVQVDISVEGQLIRNELEFKTNIPFFQKTPYPFRVFETNFGYLGEENLPFFYETAKESLFSVNKGLVSQAGLSTLKVQSAQFTTFHHPLVRQLQEILHDFGPAALMHRLTEALPLVDNRYYSNYYYNYYGNLYLGYHIAGDNQALGTIERLFEAEFDPRESVVGAAARPTNEFAYGSPFGVYNWELFFHLPMLIAEKLKQNLRFDEALKWYHYVFDPKQGLNTYEQTRRFVGGLPPGARYWTFLPFFANKDVTDSLLDTLGLKKALSDDERKQLANIIDDWRHDPFKPHLIARQRIAAYQKSVVMKYLDNLITWGDSLFRQDSFESINQATQLYILADDILGEKPQDIDSLAVPQQLAYRELVAKGLDAFSNAIVEVEYQIVTNQDYIKQNPLAPQNSASAPIRSVALKSFFFTIPRNEFLDKFWDTVADRLFKIRNSMNIDGVKRALALFQPPINPALLVAAAAAGLDLSSVISQLNTPLPHYRYSVWIQKAIDICNELKSFGAEMLSAMEKKDGEALQLLRQDHEIRILKVTRRVREQQVAEAEGNITALELQKATVEQKREEYHNRVKINSNEFQQVAQTTIAGVFDTIGGSLHALSAAFAVVPDGKVGMVGPFPLASSDFKIGTGLVNTFNALGTVSTTIAGVHHGLANLAGMQAGFERRWEDFKFQERQAVSEITQLNQQLAVANIRLDIAQKELESQEAQIENSEEVLDFLKSKFTNRDLYSFMVTQLSRTFQQVYKLAFDAAKTAERTMQFELGVEDTYIQFGYQDSLHQGLLSGEKLIHDLKRMEVGYLERYKREYEIQKPISLAVLNGAALQNLRDKGTCDFVLPETLFDLDFPGQYFRRIKSVRLTIPCVTGPHTTVSAKLTLLNSTFRKDANISSPSKYPYTGPDDPRFVQDPVGIQAIATSTGQNDAGLFELNFRDERYLPFEGAGAISTWRLELPTKSRQFDYQTISDVVVQLSYTAREGGGRLKDAAEQDIDKKLNQILTLIAADPALGLVRAFSLRREFPDVFHKLLTGLPTSPPGPNASMTLLPEHFPYIIRQRQMKTLFAPTMKVLFAPKVGKKIPSTPPPSLTVFLDAGKQVALPGAELPAGFTSQDLFLFLVQSSPPLNIDDVEDVVLIVNYTVSNPKP